MMRKASVQQFKLAAIALSVLMAVPAMAQQSAAKPGSGFLPPAAANANVIDSIAVVVNDEVITRNEISARIRAEEAAMKAQNVPIPDPAALQRQVVERMVVARAQQQLAKEMGVRVDDATLDRAIGRIAEQQKLTV